MEDELLFVMNLFEFQPISKYLKGYQYGYYKKYAKQRFEFKHKHEYGNPFSWSLKALPLIVDFYIPENSYDEATLEIIDLSSEKTVFFKKSRLEHLVIELIDNRTKYYNKFFSYHIFKVISQFNIISKKPLAIEENNFEIWSVCKEYEKGYWGGIDKDNTYTTYVKYEYFLIQDGYIIIDDFLRNTIQRSWIKTISSYKDYRPTSDVATSNYWIEKADDILLDLFKATYDAFKHRLFFDSLK